MIINTFLILCSCWNFPDVTTDASAVNVLDYTGYVQSFVVLHHYSLLQPTHYFMLHINL